MQWLICPMRMLLECTPADCLSQVFKAKGGEALAFLVQALHGAAFALASGSTESKVLLASEALLESKVSSGRQQALVAHCAKRCYHQALALLSKMDTPVDTEAICHSRKSSQGKALSASSALARFESGQLWN